MISRLVCGVVAVAMACPCLAQTSPMSSPATSVRPADLESFGVTVAANLHVTGVEPGSLADEIGLKTEDAIRDLNGVGFGSPEQFARALRAVPAGKVMRIAVSRNGSQVALAGHIDHTASGKSTMRNVSQTVVGGNGCSPYGIEYDPCCPCGPGSQHLVGNGGLRLDLSNGIGLCDPCNRCYGNSCCGANGSCGSGCGCR